MSQAGIISVSGSTPGVFTPNSTVNIFDDFIGWGLGSTAALFGQLGWNDGGNYQSSAAVDPAHPGIVANVGFSNPGSASMFLCENVNTPVNSLGLGGGVLTVNWVFKITTLSSVGNRYVLNVGLGDSTTTSATGNFSDQANGCYLKYTDNINSGNWQIVTANSSVRTTLNSSLPASIGWHNAQVVVNAAATSVSFSIDGTSFGSIATNIPTTCSPIFNANCTAGSVASTNLLIDLFYMSQVLTTPR